MSILSAPQQAELEKPVTRTAYFLELQFAGGTSRLTRSGWYRSNVGRIA